MSVVKQRAPIGKPDLNFGDRGVVDFPSSDYPWVSPDALCALANNKFMVAMAEPGFGGPIVVACMNENGSIEHDFGENQQGFVAIELDKKFLYSVNGIIGLPDGDWLIHGHCLVGFLKHGQYIVRQHKDGGRDKNFGQDGILYITAKDIETLGDAGLTLEMSVDPASTSSKRVPQGKHVAVLNQADAKIMVIANVESDTGKQTGIVLSFNSDGSINKDFNGGCLTIDLEGIAHNHHFAEVIAIQADGGVLVGGHYSGASFSTYGLFFVRLTASGQMDPTFNGGIALNVPTTRLVTPREMTVRSSDNAIVIVGEIVSDGADNGLVIVLNASGSFNRVFNNGNPLEFSLGLGGLVLESAMALDNGSIVVVGFTGRKFFGTHRSTITARLLSSGAVDTAFNGGQGYYAFEKSLTDLFPACTVLMQDGRIVTCGYSTDEQLIRGWVMRLH